jgi:hypothetical protein
MGLRIGDIAFSKSGQPGVVVGKNEKQENILSVAKEDIAKNHSQGYINGLAGKDRSQYSEIIRELESVKDPEGQVKFLREKIAALEPQTENWQLVHYLNAELSHRMFTFGIKPRTFALKE